MNHPVAVAGIVFVGLSPAGVALADVLVRSLRLDGFGTEVTYPTVSKFGCSPRTEGWRITVTWLAPILALTLHLFSCPKLENYLL